MRLFISYAHADLERVSPINEVLQAAGFVTWMDKDRLTIGDGFDEKIEETIAKHTDALLVFISSHALNSDYVKKERDTAFKNKVKILPVILDENLLGLEIVDWEFLAGKQQFCLPINAHTSHFEYARLIGKLMEQIKNVDCTNAPLKVFINYRENSNPNSFYTDDALAKALTTSLERFGAEVAWKSVKIERGEEWGEKVQAALDDCDLMLFIVSRTSLRSRRVDAAWREFLYQKKRIIVLLNDDPKEDLVSLNEQLYLSTYAMAENRKKYVNFLMTGDDQYDPALNHLLFLINQKFPGKLDGIDERAKVQENSQDIAFHVDTGALALTTPVILQSQGRFVDFHEMIARANKVIYASGVTMIKLSECTDSLTKFLDAGGQLNLLLFDPKGDYVNEISEYLGVKPKDFLKTWEEAFIKLVGLCNDDANIRIRLFKYRPPMGYFIIDPDEDNIAEMTVAPYFFNVDVVDDALKPPFTYLIKRNLDKWFDVYYKNFERMWDTSAKWEPEKRKKD